MDIFRSPISPRPPASSAGLSLGCESRIGAEVEAYGKIIGVCGTDMGGGVRKWL